MKKNIILSLLAVFIIGTIVFRFFTKQIVIPENNLWNNSSTGDKGGQNINADNALEVEDAPMQDIATSLVMNEPVTISGVEYTVNSVVRTKERNSLDMLGDRYSHIEVDENGTITNGKSYFIVNVTINNKQEEDIELTLPNFTVPIIDKLNEIYEKVEFSVFDQGMNVWAKDYGTVTLKAKEAVTYNLGYVFEDDKLDELKGQECLFFYINPNGLSLFFENHDTDNKRSLVKLDY